MSPKLHLEARKQQQHDEVMIDGSPYFPYLNVQIPDAAACVDDDDDDDNDDCKVFKGSMQAIIARNFFSSSDVTEKDPASWTVTKITGGNTNQLYCISGMNKSSSGKKNNKNKNSIPNSVLVRIFGAEGMIDRDVETSTYSSLAKQGLALKYYGRFGNGRMEEMLIGWKTLTEEDMMISQISDEIARQLAILHTTFVVPDHLIEYHDTRIEGGAQPTLWTQLYPWLERALQDQQQQQFKNEYDTDRVSRLQPSLATLKQEIDWLKLRIIDPTSSIGFCHNDLLASNIMMKNTNTCTTTTTTTSDNNNNNNESNDSIVFCNGTAPTLQFIDYEYGGINYYSYDIANHFNEYAGGTAEEDNSTPNYERRPSKEQQIQFIESYVEEYNNSNETNTNATTVTVNDIFTEVNGFILANHLVWGLWGILQASSEGCEDGLDYIQYAKCRFDQYRSDKQRYLSTSINLN